MKIKKKTGLMMIAASTAAVVGVAAVSFAAWTGGTTTFTANAATGSANIIGFTDSEPTMDLGAIVPYDQTGVYTGSTIVSVALPEFSVSGDYSITVSSETTLNLYAYIGDEQTDVPEGWSATNAGDWVNLSGENPEFVYSVTANDGAYVTVNAEGDKTVYLSLLLVSIDNDDMNASYTLTVTLEATGTNA